MPMSSARRGSLVVSVSDAGVWVAKMRARLRMAPVRLPDLAASAEGAEGLHELEIVNAAAEVTIDKADTRFHESAIVWSRVTGVGDTSGLDLTTRKAGPRQADPLRRRCSTPVRSRKRSPGDRVHLAAITPSGAAFLSGVHQAGLEITDDRAEQAARREKPRSEGAGRVLTRGRQPAVLPAADLLAAPGPRSSTWAYEF